METRPDLLSVLLHRRPGGQPKAKWNAWFFFDAGHAASPSWCRVEIKTASFLTNWLLFFWAFGGLTPSVGQVAYRVTYKIKGENFGAGQGQLICSAEQSFYTYSLGAVAPTAPVAVEGVELPVVRTDRKKQINPHRGFVRKFGQTLLYTEDITDYRYTVADDLQIQWEFLADAPRQLGGYNCQKAQAKVRGRVFVVWYAPQIAHPAGPWKLHGLPGLILEAVSTDKQYQFIFEKIEKGPVKPLDFVFHEPILDYRHYTGEVEKYHQAVAKSLQQEIQSRLKARAFSADGFKYTPKNIEKDFEKTYSASDN